MPSIAAGAGSRPEDSTPAIVVKDLVARYGDREILKGVSMIVPRHEIRVVLGPSGCGKSTLLKHLVGLLEPASGSIQILGQEIVGMNDEELAQLLTEVGMLFQGSALIQSMTLLENVMLPLREHTRLQIADAERVARMKLTTVGLGKFLPLLPAELSGGMRKRAALARAIALDPEILFCDEPTAGLDPITATGIDRLILDLRDALGITVVVVSHEVNSIRRTADRVTMLQEGKILAEGTIEEIEQSPDPRVSGFFRGAIKPAQRVPADLFAD
jgi:phospholipid/cholesterol/gamma-HCH transport system ATP-binding protein